jgi:hypothetical protein
VSGYGLDDRAVEVRSRQRWKDFSSSLCVQGPNQTPVRWVLGGPFPGAKAWPGRDADHSPHLVPRSRMSRSYASSPPSAFVACSGTALAFLTTLLVGQIIWRRMRGRSVKNDLQRWEGSIVALFKILYWHFPGGAEENHDEGEPRSPVSGPRFEPGTCRIQRNSANRSTTTFRIVVNADWTLLAHLGHCPCNVRSSYSKTFFCLLSTPADLIVWNRSSKLYLRFPCDL